MQNPKVLLLYISEISGHHQAALAIESAIKLLNPQAEVLCLNAFSYTNPITEKIINRLYLGIIKRTPGIWDYLYDNQSILKRTQKIKEAIHRSNSPKLKKLFDTFNPGVVACTQAFPCGMVADFKRTYNVDVPLVGVLTDYAPHSYWIYDNVNHYIVPSQEVKDRFVNKGVAVGKIRDYGIPVDPKFSIFHNKEELAAKFGLTTQKPIIMVMGGGQGLGPINKIVNAYKNIRVDSQLVVITGTNEKLYWRLKDKEKKLKKKMAVFGFINNIDELMEISTVIVTKPGGLTTAEALIKGLPLLIIEPLPGQEEINTTFLLNKGAAVKITKEKFLPYIMQTLISNENMLGQMKKAVFNISKPDASMDIAKLLLGLCSTT